MTPEEPNPQISSAAAPLQRLPLLWRAHRGRDPGAELRKLNARFRAISRRWERASQIRRLARHARTFVVVAMASILIASAITKWSPWPLPDLKEFYR